MEVAKIERALAEIERAIFAYRVHSFAQLTGDDLLKKAQERAPDPAVFDEHPPFFWRAQISNGRLDSYFTRMMPSSLRNYAREAGEGVAFLIGHDVRSEGVGRSLTGRYYTPGDGDEFHRVEADFFTLRNYDPRADRLVTRVRAGLSSDVSIGFYGGRFVCSICGRDMLRDWDCWHVPGIEYVAERDGVKTAEKIMAEAAVEDAHLAETSDVYEGATPAAAILKAHRAAGAGQLKPETARLLEARYRVALPAAPRAFAGAATHPPTQEADMAEPTTEATGQPTQGQRADAPSTAAGAPTVTVDPREVEEIRAALETATRTIDEANARITGLEAEVSRLTPLAKDGERYRADLIDAALTEGVRALGDKLDRDQWAGMLGRMTLDEIRLIHEGWAGKAAERFPGGRLTVDEDEGAKQQPKRAAPAVPLSAYR